MSPCYHQLIDARLVRLVEAAVQKIDATPTLRSDMEKNVSRWTNKELQARWQQWLRLPWPELRASLLAPTEAGAAMRQDAPLGGILTDAERGRIMREFAYDPRAA